MLRHELALRMHVSDGGKADALFRGATEALQDETVWGHLPSKVSRVVAKGVQAVEDEARWLRLGDKARQVAYKRAKAARDAGEVFDIDEDRFWRFNIKTQGRLQAARMNQSFAVLDALDLREAFTGDLPFDAEKLARFSDEARSYSKRD